MCLKKTGPWKLRDIGLLWELLAAAYELLLKVCKTATFESDTSQASEDIAGKISRLWGVILISYPDLLLTKPKARSGRVRKFNFYDSIKFVV